MDTFSSIEQHLAALHSLLGDTSAATAQAVMSRMSDDDLAVVMTEAAGVIRAMEPLRRASATIVTERSLGRSGGAEPATPRVVSI
ncbi:hypothetical protein LK09_02735 [Microbacterium mangrovi]|uniref:Uncharacterized protein n=1 Tax=Microbacterium mangrovi TaxID=1348253 RepID=A0A0B2A8X8_9MICO|nr:hypothetical protein [Microbacterium mangrovi]KHK99555.1 hypothetical protein LK09_02735 [Microbacterium mangrovi]